MSTARSIHRPGATRVGSRIGPAAQRLQTRLRPMQEADLSAVLAIEHRAYRFPWTEGIFRDCLRVGYCCWVLDAARGPVGYGIMSAAAGEAHILNLAIDPRQQRCGLGTKLMRHLLDLAVRHRAADVVLEVRPSNVAALRLYCALGFNEVGLRKAYYPAANGKEDAIILARTLIRDFPLES